MKLVLYALKFYGYSNSDDTTEYEEDIQKDKKGINKNIYLPKKDSIILKKQKINSDNQANKCC